MTPFSVAASGAAAGKVVGAQQAGEELNRSKGAFSRACFFLKLSYTYFMVLVGISFHPWLEVVREKDFSSASSHCGWRVLLRGENGTLRVLHPDRLTHLLQQLVSC